MPTRNSTALMWAQACEMVEQAERMHRQFFRLSTSRRRHPAWEPPVNLFENDDAVTIVVALPGVAAQDIEVELEDGTVVIRAEGRVAFGAHDVSVRRLEIPYGYFKRRLQLPPGRYISAQRELIDGCLVLTLRKVQS